MLNECVDKPITQGNNAVMPSTHKLDTIYIVAHRMVHV